MKTILAGSQQVTVWLRARGNGTEVWFRGPDGQQWSINVATAWIPNLLELWTDRQLATLLEAGRNGSIQCASMPPRVTMVIGTWDLEREESRFEPAG